MNRREFIAAGIGGTLGAQGVRAEQAGGDDPVRALFPRLEQSTFLNAASGTPLSRFAERGLHRYEQSWRHGGGASRTQVMDRARSGFARLIGAQPGEIGLVHCTKAGEQIVLQSLLGLRSDGNVVTNDLHFGGSLHNLIGRRRSGWDVRIVRSRDWQVDLAEMDRAIDERTRLVCVTMVSNVNGRIEPLRELGAIAHARGALLYADIIQAAGIVPIDVARLGIDFAACSGYKWLFGPHGVGFFFCRQELQGGALPDELFPGFATPNYPPWVESADAEQGDYSYAEPTDARRYQPGHVSYLGYSALIEALDFIHAKGVDHLLEHSVRLNQRLLERIDLERYPCISPDTDRSPIVSFATSKARALAESLAADHILVSASPSYLRVSPAIYNTEDDVDRLADALNDA